METREMSSDIREFKFIHFNDVYNIEGFNIDPVGGASRFISLLEMLKEEHPNTKVLFSGDIFGGSAMSTIFQGEQMIPIMNKIGIDATCFGNHEFDYGNDHLTKLLKNLNPSFPWILSNLTIYSDNEDKDFIFGEDSDIVKKYLIKDFGNIRVGFIGLIEEEWISSCPTFKQMKFKYHDYNEITQKYVTLFNEKECDLIIALTHMREGNNLILANNNPEIDLILGGHEHFLLNKTVNKSTNIIISGTDFMNTSHTTITLPSKDILKKLKQNFLIETNENIQSFNSIASVTNIPSIENHYKESNYDANSKILNYLNSKDIQTTTHFIKKDIKIKTDLFLVTQQLPEDKETKTIVDKWMAKLGDSFNIPLIYLHSQIDSRSQIIRKNDSSIANFICDLVTLYYQCDTFIFNSGSIRTDYILSGEFSYGTLKKMFPFNYDLLKLKIKAKDLKTAYETALKRYPILDGSYPNASNIGFNCVKQKKKVTVNSMFDLKTKADINDDKEFIVITRTKLYEGLNDWEFPNHVILETEVEKKSDDIFYFFFEELNRSITCKSDFTEENMFDFGFSDKKSLFEFINKHIIFVDEDKKKDLNGLNFEFDINKSYERRTFIEDKDLK